MEGGEITAEEQAIADVNRAAMRLEVAAAKALRIELSGETYPLRDRLREAGYRWDPRAQQWSRESNLATAEAIIAGTWCGLTTWVSLTIRLVADGGKIVWARLPVGVAHAPVGNCAACGEWGPLRPTPHGMVCHECAGEAA
jgi:hypothetical protein